MDRQMGEIGRFADPKFWLRVKTSIKTSTVVVLFSLLMFIDDFMKETPIIAIILGACYLTIIMHASAVGSIRNATEAVKGGFVGFIIAFALISGNNWYRVVCICIISFALAFNDPGMARGIFTKFAAIDAFCSLNIKILYTPKLFHPLATSVPMYFVVCHVIAYILVVLCSTLIWPQLSSKQFMLELRYCTRICKELFLLLSFKLDTEIIPHNSDEGDRVRLLGFNREKDLDKRIKYLEHDYYDQIRYSKKLVRLGRLLKESKWESWNGQRTTEYEKMLELMERLLRQLVSTREALSKGKFSRGINSNFVSPMVPLLETLQASIISHLDKIVSPPKKNTPLSPLSPSSSSSSSSNSIPPPPSSSSPSSSSSIPSSSSSSSSSVQNPAPVTTDDVSISIGLSSPSHLPSPSSSSPIPPLLDPAEIGRMMDQKYTEIVQHYEAENKSANPSSEITRMVFTIFGDVEFSQYLHQLEDSISRLPPDDTNIPFLVFRDLWKQFRSLSPIVGTLRWVGECFNDLKNGLKELAKMSLKEIFTSPRIQFPIRFTVGIALLSIVLTSLPTHVTSKVPHYNPLWPAATFIIAILPSLGATMRKCFHRILGTVVGAFTGYASMEVMLQVKYEFQIFPYIFLFFPYLMITCYFQQIPKFAYSGTVAGLTYLIVVVTQYETQTNHVEFAAMRAAFIAIGIVWVLVVSVLIFPNRSANHFQAKLVECNNKIAALFGLIIEKATSAEQIDNGIADSVKNIKTSYNVMRVHLKEAKSELMPFRWRGFKTYEQALTQINAVYYSLASILTIVEKGFYPTLFREVVRPLTAYLTGLVGPILTSAERVEAAFFLSRNISSSSSSSRGDQDVGLISISQAISAVDDQYFLLRKYLLSKRSLALLHPQLRQFYAFLFSVREFVREWKVLEESLFLSFDLGELVHEQEDPAHHNTDLITPPNTPAIRSLSSSLANLPPLSLPPNSLSSPSSSSSSPRSPLSTSASLPVPPFVDVFSSIERDLIYLQKQANEERGRADSLI